ncbi:hypothetical protein D5086_015295 [Populus alba]|uniref:Uncharacterized protein n=1 Tax=Populus alba TaxID=43335 RepID=A0ACC4BZY8_POPAL
MSERRTPTSAGKGYGMPTSSSFAKHPLPRRQTKNKILLWSAKIENLRFGATGKGKTEEWGLCRGVLGDSDRKVPRIWSSSSFAMMNIDVTNLDILGQVATEPVAQAKAMASPPLPALLTSRRQGATENNLVKGL